MIKVKRWTDGKVIWRSSAHTVADAAREAIRAGISLCKADLQGAKLDEAILDGAKLDEANLIRASLAGASLIRASLVGARLGGANLNGANLYRARLGGASLIMASLHRARLDKASLDRASLHRARLDEASLDGASLRKARLDEVSLISTRLDRAKLDGATFRNVSPTMFLLADWGEVSDDLCRDLMRLDASAHPDPAAFDRWAADGTCPYYGTGMNRAAYFKERRELWEPGPPPSIFELVQRLLAERGCKWP